MNSKQKSFVSLCILLGLGSLHGFPFVVADTIDQDSFEKLGPDMAAAIERIAPRKYSRSRTASSTAISLLDGNIGHIHAEDVLNGDLASVRNLILEHAILTGATQQLEVEFVEMRPDTDGHKLIYRQLINSIPTKYRSSIVFDGSGNATSMSSHFIDPSFAASGPQVLEDEAITHAFTALMQWTRRNIDDIAIHSSPDSQPELYYGYAGDNPNPQLFWRMNVESRSHGMHFSAVVNATTGETTVTNSIDEWPTR